MMYNNLLGVTPRPRAKTSGLGVGSASWRIRCTLRTLRCPARLPTVAPFRACPAWRDTSRGRTPGLPLFHKFFLII